MFEKAKPILIDEDTEAKLDVLSAQLGLNKDDVLVSALAIGMHAINTYIEVAGKENTDDLIMDIIIGRLCFEDGEQKVQVVESHVIDPESLFKHLR